MIKKIFIFIVLLLTGFNGISQGDKILTNSLIVDLVKSGFGEQIIIAKIKNSVCSFNLEIDSMVWLKKKGVTDNILAEMMNVKSVKLTSGGSDNPNEMHSSGIYFMDTISGNCKMRFIDENVISQRSSTGVAVYGVPLSSSSTYIDGIQSRFIVKTNLPVFYFYFNETGGESSLNNAGFESYKATSPNQFSVIQFSINTSKNHRSIQTSSGVGYSVASGISSKCKIPFDYERVGEGIYKVFFNDLLKNGEYAFIYSGATGSNDRIYDFSIQGYELSSESKVKSETKSNSERESKSSNSKVYDFIFR